MKFNLYEEIYFETKIPNLRFHISMKDAEALLKNNLITKKITTSCRKILISFVERIDIMQKKFKESLFGRRRRHVLIGQDIMKHFVAVQFDQVALFLNPLHLVESTSIFKKINQVKDIAQNNVSQEFSKNEFENLEDEDHDSTGEYYKIEELSD